MHKHLCALGVLEMRLSTRGRFAITAMIDLALQAESGPVPLADIALRHRISLSYLEQVFSKLRNNRLVVSTRGPGGGYMLGLQGGAITVAQIIRAIEDAQEVPSATAILERAPSTRDMTQDLWDSLHSTIETYLETITLNSLASEQRAKGYQSKERKTLRKGIFKTASLMPPRTNAPNSVFALAKSLAVNG
jgi:Rrf2 family iron-sulfur cluster assembly transcriptional regulator